jgi:hypothetical protein
MTFDELVAELRAVPVGEDRTTRPAQYLAPLSTEEVGIAAHRAGWVAISLDHSPEVIFERRYP